MFPSTAPAPGPGLLPGHNPRVLRYPANSLLLVGGVPGAGKSTLINRLFALDGTEPHTVQRPGGVRVIDSQQSRNRLTRRLRAFPYPAWRWVMHCLHYLRIFSALRAGDGPVVVHESATRQPVRRLLGWYCRRRGYEVHLLLIDVGPEAALRGQIERGRRIAPRSHRRHMQRWPRLLVDCAAGAGAVVPGARSLVLMERAEVAGLAEIRFTTGSAGPAGGGAAPAAVP
ncbi:AAA family ATPase [Streptomonospora sediminis]